MKKSNSRTLLKYVLIQIPDFALLVVILFLLEKWIDLSLWLAGSIVVLWIIKDILLYPLLRRSYAGCSSKDHPMIGERGIARDRLDPSGYVWVRGELWRAEAANNSGPIEEGEALTVQHARGLTLQVVPDRHGH